MYSLPSVTVRVPCMQEKMNFFRNGKMRFPERFFYSYNQQAQN